MDYVSVKDLSEKWNVSKRWIQELIAKDRIPGVIKMGNMYLVPKDAVKPEDKRRKESR